MTMPTFEPVAYMVETTHKVSGEKGTWISTDKSGWGNMVSVEYGKQESLFAESQLTAAYEAGLRDAVPKSWRLVPNEPTEEMVAAFWGEIRHGDIELAHAWDAYKEMLAAAQKGEKE